jgi:D-alanine-D-alanine ligase
MKHIAILMGGLSSEREVSLQSGRAVVKAAESLGYKVTPVDVGKDVAERLTELKPDVAFIALHGTYGEDGCIQGLLEVLGIPYTHSGVRASAIGMDKEVTKQLLSQHGIPFPQGKVVDRDELLEVYAMGEDIMPRPFVIKPVAEGSSVGVHIVKHGDNESITSKDWKPGTRLLVEQYIPGHELSVAVIGDEALGVIELSPKQGFYTYEAKYTEGKTDHLMPAPVPEAIYQQAMDDALKAHQALGCRGVSRSDFRYNDTSHGEAGLFMLEINTHPGFTPLSLVPEIAAYKGITFPELVDRLIKEARCDHQKTEKPKKGKVTRPNAIQA